MCWKCDNPDKTDDDYFAELRRDIDKYGWIVQSVEDDRRPYAYTIGLHDRGLPELLITGIEPKRVLPILNTCAQMMCDGSVFKPGETVGLWDRSLFMIVRVDNPEGKSPGVVGFRELGVGVPGLLAGVSLPGLGWAIA